MILLQIFSAATTLLIGLLSIIGWFIKKDVVEFGKRLDKHDELLLKLVSDVSMLIGFQKGSRHSADLHIE